MKCDVLALSLPVAPSCAAFSRRTGLVFAANPFKYFSTTHRTGSFDQDAQLPRFEYKGPADCLQLSVDERVLALSAQQVIKFFDVTTGRETRNLPAHYMPIKALCPCPKSCYSWYSGSLDTSWCKWDMREASSRPSEAVSGRVGGPIRSLAVSPDEKLVAIGTDSALTLYDTRQRRPLKQFSASALGLSFNTSEQMMTSFGRDRVVRYWCPMELECVAVSDAFGDDIRTMSFAHRDHSGDDDFLLVSTDAELRVLTAWEPCQTKNSLALPSMFKVLEVNMDTESVDMISFGDDMSLVHFSFTVQELLSSSSISMSSDEDLRAPSRESPAVDDIIIEQMEVEREAAPPTKTPPATPVVPKTNGTNTRAPASTTRSKRVPKSLAVPSVSSSTASPKSNGPSRGVRSRSNSPALRSAASTTSLNQSTTRKKAPTPPSSEEGDDAKASMLNISKMCSDLLKPNKNFGMAMTRRISALEMADAMASQDGALSAAEHMGHEAAVLGPILSHLEQSRQWDMRTAKQLLPHIRASIGDPSCSEACVSALRSIASRLLPVILNVARTKCNLGVDVAAEERKKLAEDCLEELRELRDQRKKYLLRMSRTTAVQFEMLLDMPAFKNI